MKVGFYQFVPEFGNVDKNMETMVNAVKAANADLVVFPELATSGYLFLDQKEVEETASVVPGPMSDAFSKVAVETDTAVVVPEKPCVQRGKAFLQAWQSGVPCFRG